MLKEEWPIRRSGPVRVAHGPYLQQPKGHTTAERDPRDRTRHCQVTPQKADMPQCIHMQHHSANIAAPQQRKGLACYCKSHFLVCFICKAAARRGHGGRPWFPTLKCGHSGRGFGFLVLLALGCALTQNCATVASLWRAHVHRFHAPQYIK